MIVLILIYLKIKKNSRFYPRGLAQLVGVTAVRMLPVIQHAVQVPSEIPMGSCTLTLQFTLHWVPSSEQGDMLGSFPGSYFQGKKRRIADFRDLHSVYEMHFNTLILIGFLQNKLFVKGQSNNTCGKYQVLQQKRSRIKMKEKKLMTTTCGNNTTGEKTCKVFEFLLSQGFFN